MLTWVTRLPQQIVKRDIYVTTLQKALEIKKRCFVKPSIGKFFRSGLYNQKSLSKATKNLPNNMLVQIQEPVIWTAEYRCFVVEKRTVSVSSYFSNSHQLFFNASNSELKEAKRFANSIFEEYDIDTPPSFTLDIGIIKSEGWAVVECNEAWAAGIYSCDPVKVLKALLKASIPIKKFSEKYKKWDAKENFLSVFSEPFYSLEGY
ncbi:MAG: ATP-grasp domain-containing protein [Candidatus Brocadiae bacterium]|nr:ATP-grasp domain-containing protein [Candidatus Brocadiia bacterium]